MSTTLTVLTKSTPDPRVFDVYWAAGVHTQGVLSVRVQTDVDDLDLVAELAAIQRLLEVDEVCSQDRTGNNLTITVSFGAVKKLAAGRSAKAELAPYALFLRTRWVEADIHVSKSDAFINLPRAHSRPSQLTVERPLPSCVRLPTGEHVGVSSHALEQFQIRFSFDKPGHAWRALRQAATHSATRQSSPSRDEQARHGRSVRAFDSFNGCRFIVVDDGVQPMIVTAYWNHRAKSTYEKFSQQSVA